MYVNAGWGLPHHERHDYGNKRAKSRRSAPSLAGRVASAAGEGWGGGSVPASAIDVDDSPFTYTFPATVYVNAGWGLPHHADAIAGTSVQNPAALPPPSQDA